MFRKFFTNSPRIGRLMEILDYIAVEVSYKYIYSEIGSDKATLVTACVDHMNFFSKINNKKDLIIVAYPTFAGRSSIEI